MDGIKSSINPMLSLDYILTADENKWFDRKSAKLRVADIAPIISAFANAEGGTIVIGVDEKQRFIEGVDSVGAQKVNEFVLSPKDCCKPMPEYKEEFLDVKNVKGEKDRLLLLHIFSNPDQVIRTNNDSTYLRIGDRTKELKGEDLRNLEYSKGLRHYEDECSFDATIEDLDADLLDTYREKLQASDIPYWQILKSRGFVKKKNDQECLTNGAVLLFARDIQRFYPNSRVRFIRYDGTSAKTGTQMNIVRDYNIELPLLRILEKTREFIGLQLREFIALNPQTGRFQVVPEYPEFAWTEGIVNAVAHREYSMSGSYIRVSMFDDRLEIESPGKLPSMVTVDNIKETRYSRNPRIARVLTEFGWVRELNEGVKRIYADMEKFFLDDPEYSEPGASVRLVLRNNIVMRNLRKKDWTMESIGDEAWETLEDVEHQILVFMSEKKSVTRQELQNHLKRSGAFVTKRLSKLMDMGIVKSNGHTNDPKRTYSIVFRQ